MNLHSRAPRGLTVALRVALFSASVLCLQIEPRGVHGFQTPGEAGDKAVVEKQPAEQGENQEAEPKVKLGLYLNDPRAFQGYTLLSPLGSTKSFLLDMEGRAVRTWDCGCTPTSSYLLENGNLLRLGKVPPEEQKPGFAPGEAGRIQEFTFDGEVVWDYKYASDTQISHHDIHKLPNGNVLMLVWEKKTRDEAIAAGRAPETLGDGGLIPDCLMEVKPTGKTTGEIVWEWHLWDHLIQDKDSSKPNYGNVAEHPELVDLNYRERPEESLANPAAVAKLAAIGYAAAGAAAQPVNTDADWTHCNGIDYNAEFDQIVISVCHFSEIWIIDHSTTTEDAKGHAGGRSGKGGDLLYRWGNPIVYGAGTEKDQKLFGQHNVHWIPRGYPGEGHLLLFNNKQKDEEGKFSSVDELATPVDQRGNYQRPTGEAFGPERPTWSYTAPKKTDLYSFFISGAQRLANGNTLICSGSHGALTEITPDKELVWKYINPTKESPFGPGGPGGPGGNFFGPPPIGKLLPPFAMDMLKLTDEQKKQLEEIEKMAREKLEQVLNDDQRKQFADLQRNPFPFPPGGPGGGPNFGPPGPGGPGGQANFGPPGGGGGPNFGPPGGGGRGPGGGNLALAGRAVPPDLMEGPPGGTPVFRAYRYAVDYVGFAGKNLTPGKTLVEIVDEAEKEKQKETEKDAGEKKDGEQDSSKS